MEKSTFATAHAPEAAPLSADPARAEAADETRSLADWELLMVGGGETSPNW